jgi:hypothetical protein
MVEVRTSCVHKPRQSCADECGRLALSMPFDFDRTIFDQIAESHASHWGRGKIPPNPSFSGLGGEIRLRRQQRARMPEIPSGRTECGKVVLQ